MTCILIYEKILKKGPVYFCTSMFLCLNILICRQRDCQNFMKYAKALVLGEEKDLLR